MRTRSKAADGLEVKGEATAGSGCETPRVILEAARTRFLHYGFKKTTIDEIALDARVGKGTVYLYFDSKEDILLHIVREVKRNITEQMRCIAGGSLISSEEKMRRMMLAMLLTVHDAVWSTAHGVELVDELLQPKLMRFGSEEQDKQMALLAEVLRDGVRRGELSVPNNDVEAAARHFKLAMISFLPPNVRPCHAEIGCRASLEVQVNAMVEFIFHGLRRR